MSKQFGNYRRKIRLVEGNATCHHVCKLTCKGTLRPVFICLRPPQLFCLGWSSDFVGSESGQIQSVKLLQNMIYRRTSYPPPPSLTHCIVYKVHFFTQGRGGRGTRGESTVLYPLSNFKKGLKRTIRFYLLPNVWKCTMFWAYAFKICKKSNYDPQIVFSSNKYRGIKNTTFKKCSGKK